jgi:hypothetical protein
MSSYELVKLIARTRDARAEGVQRLLLPGHCPAWSDSWFSSDPQPHAIQVSHGSSSFDDAE